MNMAHRRCEDAPCCGCCPDYTQAEPYDPEFMDHDFDDVDHDFDDVDHDFDDDVDHDFDDDVDRSYDDEEPDQFRDDVEADADVLRSAGFGTDEDYGAYEDMGDWGYGD